MVEPSVTGIGVIAGFSAIVAMLNICGTGWVLGTQFVNLDTKLQSLGLPDPKIYQECSRKYSERDCTMYTELVTGMETRWRKNQPILITCAALALFVGFFQLTISLLVCFSEPKRNRKTVRLWMTSHFIFALVLLLCLLSVFLTRTGHDMGEESWPDLVQDLEKTLQKMEPEKDLSSFSTFLKIGSVIFYSSVGTNFIAICILFFTTIFVLHKYNEYEWQE